jgi:hypothetical protein
LQVTKLTKKNRTLTMQMAALQAQIDGEHDKQAKIASTIGASQVVAVALDLQGAAVKQDVKVDLQVAPLVTFHVQVQPAVPPVDDGQIKPDVQPPMPLQPPMPTVDNGAVGVVKQQVVPPVAAPVAPWSICTQIICVVWVMAITLLVLFKILLYLHDMQEPTSEYVHEGDYGPKAPAPPAPKPTEQSMMWTCVYTAVLAVSFIPGMIFLT